MILFEPYSRFFVYNYRPYIIHEGICETLTSCRSICNAIHAGIFRYEYSEAKIAKMCNNFGFFMMSIKNLCHKSTWITAIKVSIESFQLLAVFAIKNSSILHWICYSLCNSFSFHVSRYSYSFWFPSLRISKFLQCSLGLLDKFVSFSLKNFHKNENLLFYSFHSNVHIFDFFGYMRVYISFLKSEFLN